MLRYDRGGEPLWISSKGILNNDKVPNCELCNGKRVLEFQVSLYIQQKFPNFENKILYEINQANLFI